eukprot:3020852-Pyramimonas_sp.AAC.1
MRSRPRCRWPAGGVPPRGHGAAREQPPPRPGREARSPRGVGGHRSRRCPTKRNYWGAPPRPRHPLASWRGPRRRRRAEGRQGRLLARAVR